MVKILCCERPCGAPSKLGSVLGHVLVPLEKMSMCLACMDAEFRYAVPGWTFENLEDHSSSVIFHSTTNMSNHSIVDDGSIARAKV